MSELVIEMGTEEIKDYEYADTDYRDIYIPDTVTVIGAGAFKNCKNVKKILIPNSVEYIGAGAFEGCENLENVAITHTIKIIEKDAFKNCNNLNSVMILSTLEEMKEKFIDNEAFPEHVKIDYKYTKKELLKMGCSKEKIKEYESVYSKMENMDYIKRK